jgi:hypothetical protein
VRGLNVRVVAEEVHVVEQQALDKRIAEVAAHARLDERQVALVHDLVALDVERPIAGAGRERDVRLLREDLAAHEQRRIPDRLDDPDLRAVDRAQEIGRAVRGVAGGDHQLVAHREDRCDRLDDGVREVDRVADEAEPADPHPERAESGFASFANASNAAYLYMSDSVG